MKHEKEVWISDNGLLNLKEGYNRFNASFSLVKEGYYQNKVKITWEEKVPVKKYNIVYDGGDYYGVSGLKFKSIDEYNKLSPVNKGIHLILESEVISYE